LALLGGIAARFFRGPPANTQRKMAALKIFTITNITLPFDVQMHRPEANANRRNR
jgi:hypothetical protein